MSWIYKMKNKLSVDHTKLGSMVSICPKCHYILLIREGEKPVWCPMCGERNVPVKNAETKKEKK